MHLDFDEAQWPGLSAFRQACLSNDISQMQEIAGQGHHWYSTENPDGIALERLAVMFQWQYHAAISDCDTIAELHARAPWGLNEPWTAQGWLPITQATANPGDGFDALRLLLKLGADPLKEAGDPGERIDAAGSARYAGNPGLAAWLERESAKPEPGTTLVIQKTSKLPVTPEAVYAALTSSDAIVRYFPYESVEATWQEGGDITFKGEAGGAPFTDYGTIEVLKAPATFQYAYWSDNHGTERTPENHLRIRYDLSPSGAGTQLTVTQFDIQSGDYREMMAGAWDMLLGALASHLQTSP